MIQLSSDGTGSGGGSSSRTPVVVSDVPKAGPAPAPTMDRQAAQAFLQHKLAGLDVPSFPPSPIKTHRPKSDELVSRFMPSVQWCFGYPPTTILCAAWAVLIHWYIDTPEVLFEVAASPCHASGKPAPNLPYRVPVLGTIDRLLLTIQRLATELAPLEQYGLQNVEQARANIRAACSLQSLLTLNHVAPATFEHDYALIANCQVNGSSLELTLLFDSDVVNPITARRILQQLSHIIDQINSAPNTTTISSFSRINQQELRQLWEQQAIVPESVEDCVHKVFAKRTAGAPQAPAVCAWDGEMTYAQLDRRSTLLAQHLLSLDLDITSDTVVPLYFEKSKWVPVAILAVMKAGGASVALDSTLPQSRVESIVDQVLPVVILSSKSCAHLARHVSDALVITVDDDLDALNFSQPPLQMPEVDPSSNLYIVFTSGSTGVPKGATVTHTNFCSAAVHQQERLGFGPSSRVFDYTSYSFDVAWSNVLHTLMIGACLCIPSEYDRTADISGSINRLRADFVHLTPTLGRFLDPATLGGLTKILFIGEALKASDVARWSTSNADLYNTYGPAECTVTSTIFKISRNDKQNSDPSIGVGVGCLPWITQPANPTKLAAIGTVGELWLEGPIVGAGYWKNPEKTAEAFVEDPEWLVRGVPGHISGRRGTLYRTGDLASYAPDGSLQFIGRKDRQVKFNGQRMELGEVEVNCRELLPFDIVSQVVVDVVIPDITRNQTLAAFLVMSADDLKTKFPFMVTELGKKMAERLPSFMVPSAYIPLEKLPMTASGKTDGKGIQALGRAYNPLISSHLNSYAFDSTLSETEDTLRTTWAEVLGIQAEKINARHTFVELGGNSIKTMSLAMAIHKRFDVNIGVQQLVGRQRSLRELSSMIDSLQQGKSIDEPTPVDLEREVDLLAGGINYCRSVSVGTVFLTGATGFLGSQILRNTLAKRAFGKVVVLVRPVSGKSGMDRVRKAAVTAGWWRESYASTIEVWYGDLAAENLGLSDPFWYALCGRPSSAGTIEAIIHNGATVHWSSNYDDLKAVNVGSTIKLLKAAMDSPFVQSFVYVSGGLITDSRIWTKEDEAKANGYDQSKYVSERLVSAACAKSRKNDTKFSVVKPGQIIGDVFTGAANMDDFLWRVVTSAIRLGARPIESDSSWLSISDVLHVAETVLWHAIGKSNEDFTHIKRGIWVNTFWAIVEEQLQKPLLPVTWDEWTELAKQDMAEERELHPLYPVQQYLGALGTENLCGDMCGWEMQEVVTTTRRNIKYLLQGKGLTSKMGLELQCSHEITV
jgi:amino acid adenylation domain-containing protein/thioester reductase-like protein